MSVPQSFTVKPGGSSSCNKSYDNEPKATKPLCKMFLSAAAYLLSHSYGPGWVIMLKPRYQEHSFMRILYFCVHTLD